jgi:hypothetical protein
MQLMMTDDDTLPNVEDVQDKVSEAEVAALAAAPATFTAGRNARKPEAAKEA